MIHSMRCEGGLQSGTSRTLRLVVQAGLLLSMAGCGGGSRPSIGPIQFTSSSGAGVPAVSTLAINGQVHMIADVTNDDQFLGVSWTASCGSAAPPGGGSIDNSCGTFNPAETASGPVPQYPSTGIVASYTAPGAVPKGGTVTLTAHATALPSVTSSVTIAIAPGATGAQEPRTAE